MGNNLLVTILGFDFNSIWWGITYGMYWLINAIQNAFWILAGVTDVNAGKEPNQGTDGTPTDILSYLFQSTSVQNAFLWFLIVGGTITVISVAIGMIKATFQDNDGVTSRWKILEKSIEALVITLLMPLIMYVCVAITGLFMQWIISVMNYALGSESTTIADQLHIICLNTSEENLKQLIQQGHSNIKSWSVSFDELKSAGLSDSYQYFTAMIASGILIYVLIAVCTKNNNAKFKGLKVESDIN
jgi:hypothetical protein